MVKKRWLWILVFLLGVVILIWVGFLLANPPDWSGELAIEKTRGLPEGKAIQVRTRVADLGVNKGDAFPYFVEVLYNPALVAKIDKTYFDDSVDLNPFEIRSIREQEFTLDSRTRVYQREYEIQLVNGPVNQLYVFPTLIVRYSPKGSAGVTNTSVEPEPVFVGTRMPSEVQDLAFGYGPLRPIARPVEGVNPLLPQSLWVLGSLLVLVGVVDLIRRSVPQENEDVREKRQAAETGPVYAAYRSLSKNAASAADPKSLLHQADHILRITLADKEKLDWLREFNAGVISPDIRKSVVSLLENCQKAYNCK